ncbi:MAG: hypothetical protein IKO10_06080 [Lachnospiraceae bacterium]|nr:hypothetical protein [Lachnospiraceae bacterium]
MDKNQEIYKELINACYEDYAVCFADILGTKELLIQSKTPYDAGFPEAILNALANQANSIEKIKVVQISDCMYIITKIENIDEMIRFLGCLILQLFNSSEQRINYTGSNPINNCDMPIFMLRGGITRGKAVFLNEQKNIIGPALCRAYEIECQEAIKPRIVLDGNIIEIFRNREDIFSIDEDGKYYFDFLKYWTSRKEKINLDWMIPILENKINKCIEEEKKKENEKNVIISKKDKFEWMIKYIRDRVN